MATNFCLFILANSSSHIPSSANCIWQCEQVLWQETRRGWTYSPGSFYMLQLVVTANVFFCVSNFRFLLKTPIFRIALIPAQEKQPCFFNGLSYALIAHPSKCQ